MLAGVLVTCVRSLAVGRAVERKRPQVNLYLARPQAVVLGHGLQPNRVGEHFFDFLIECLAIGGGGAAFFRRKNFFFFLWGRRRRRGLSDIYDSRCIYFIIYRGFCCNNRGFCCRNWGFCCNNPKWQPFGQFPALGLEIPPLYGRRREYLGFAITQILCEEFALEAKFDYLVNQLRGHGAYKVFDYLQAQRFVPQSVIPIAVYRAEQS